MTVEQITLLLGVALVAFILSAILGKWLIPVLHRLKFGQTIREIGPAWHQKKQGTPTMGGILFIFGALAAVIAGMVVCELVFKIQLFSGTPATLTRLFGGLLLAFCCGWIGFADDYIKVVKKRNLGLTSLQKLMAQLLVSLGYACSAYLAGGTDIYIPFLGTVYLGIWYIPVCMFLIVGFTNATNLTDGVDGLCGSVTVVASGAFLAAAALLGYFGQCLWAAALIGALLGFLVWNLHPARVFMGDTGSLFLGGALCAIAFGIGHPLLLLPFGIVYVVETASVILQVGYFKLTHGKRLFKMSPIHHHFEMCGWKENTIVGVACLVTLVVSALTLWLMMRG
ncbi:MAG: phospho-N-acetylmuramoyl-pentapeptide-transferase [Clostridia bacterium]|nr:phospho-N-acetylmuramoyl-pentapeptide-transferase [Clostridia bacterium]